MFVRTQSGPLDTLWPNWHTAKRATCPAAHMPNIDLSQKPKQLLVLQPDSKVGAAS